MERIVDVYPAMGAECSLEALLSQFSIEDAQRTVRELIHPVISLGDEAPFNREKVLKELDEAERFAAKLVASGNSGGLTNVEDVVVLRLYLTSATAYSGVNRWWQMRSILSTTDPYFQKDPKYPSCWDGIATRVAIAFFKLPPCECKKVYRGFHGEPPGATGQRFTLPWHASCTGKLKTLESHLDKQLQKGSKKEAAGRKGAVKVLLEIQAKTCRNVKPFNDAQQDEYLFLPGTTFSYCSRGSIINGALLIQLKEEVPCEAAVNALDASLFSELPGEISDQCFFPADWWRNAPAGDGEQPTAVAGASAEPAGDKTAAMELPSTAFALPIDKITKLPNGKNRPLTMVGSGRRSIVQHCVFYGTDVAFKQFEGKLSTDADVQLCVKKYHELNHPQIVEFIAFVTCAKGRLAGYLSEYCAGGTLATWLAVSSDLGIVDNTTDLHASCTGVMNPPRGYPAYCAGERIRIARSVMQAISYLHSVGLANSAIDSHHVMFTVYNEVKVLPNFRSLVQRQDAKTRAADVGDFGWLLWELHHPVEVALGKVQRKATQRPLIAEDVDPAMAKLINDCWQGDHSSRPSAAKVLERLAEMSRGGSSSAA